MAPFEDWRLIQIFKVKGNDAVAPAGVVRVSVGTSSLSDVRSEAARNLIEAPDLFLLPSPNSLSAFCPITQADEQRISVNEYFCATQVCAYIDANTLLIGRLLAANHNHLLW